MDTPKNSFKQKALTKEITYGIWNGLVDTVTAEIIAGAGFDWILVDGEHAPLICEPSNYNYKLLLHITFKWL